MMMDYKWKKEFPYWIEKALEKKLFLMAKRLEKGDVWIILDGDEGAGKSNMATYLLYAMHCITGRKFTQDNFFFDAKKMFEFAKSTRGQLINWDEAAIGGLSRQWHNKTQVNLMQFAMTGRILHHFVVLCIPKFDKLQEYFVRDRSVALIHVYERKNMQKGRFLYYDKKGKEALYDTWNRKHVRAYKKYAKIRGSFPEVMSKLIDENKYDEAKIDTIRELGLGADGTNIWKDKLEEMKKKFAKAYVIQENKNKALFAQEVGMNMRTLQKYVKSYIKEGDGYKTNTEHRTNYNNWDKDKNNLEKPMGIEK